MSLAVAFEVVVETEPEWDDDERTRMRALEAHEAGLCDCGFPTAVAADRSNFFTFEDRRCPVCAAAARYGRIQHDADEKARKASGENSPPGTPQPDDGRKTFLRRMSDDEVTEARDRRATARRGA